MHEEKTGGRIRKIVAMDGHFGPKEIGTQPEFFDWLSDPVRNGGGRAVRLRLLRRQHRDMAARQRTAAPRHGRDAAPQARDLPEGGRRGHDRHRVRGRAGHRAGVVELARPSQGPRGLHRERRGVGDGRRRAADQAAWPADRRRAGRGLAGGRAERAQLPHRRRARASRAVGADLAREQRDRLRDSRRRAREREDGTRASCCRASRSRASTLVAEVCRRAGEATEPIHGQCAAIVARGASHGHILLSCPSARSASAQRCSWHRRSVAGVAIRYAWLAATFSGPRGPDRRRRAHHDCAPRRAAVGPGLAGLHPRRGARGARSQRGSRLGRGAAAERTAAQAADRPGRAGHLPGGCARADGRS